jgi:hypothetical protein|tara:strand:+ start:1584 stop:1901 length:318 start_codon:yes stop_codon:yes gene_type:complete
MSMMMKTLRTVGAASVLVGGLFHLAGPAVFDLPLIGSAMSRIWNFGVGPATVQRLFGLVAVLYGAHALGFDDLVAKVPVIGAPVKGALNSMEHSLVPDETNSYSV